VRLHQKAFNQKKKEPRPARIGDNAAHLARRPYRQTASVRASRRKGTQIVSEKDPIGAWLLHMHESQTVLLATGTTTLAKTKSDRRPVGPRVVFVFFGCQPREKLGKAVERRMQTFADRLPRDFSSLRTCGPPWTFERAVLTSSRAPGRQERNRRTTLLCSTQTARRCRRPAPCV
jgi:hypothetical protein